MEKPQKIMKRCAAVVMVFILTVSGNGLMVNAATAQTEVTVNAGKVYQNNRPYTGWYSTGGQKYYSVNGNRIKGWRKIGGK